jgi:hypothetical protein|tara:strand:- start:518 stop:862 length:345 start_codon:yes stop_codon:yes gene_type:complete
MKKNIFFVVIFIILNGCAQYSSVVGPTYTLAKSGSIVSTGASAVTAYGFKKTTGQSPGDYVNSLVRKNYKINSFMNQKENTRECQTLHTSALNEIFFETLDEIDCFRDPFSILK